MSSGMPELGSKISLISKADIRYEGRLFTVDPQECTIALSNVRSFGTEEREASFHVAPQSQIYDYILFRGSDIKDIRVVHSVNPIPNDPAIVTLSVPPPLASSGFQQQQQQPQQPPQQQAPGAFSHGGMLGHIGSSQFGSFSGMGGGLPSGLAPGMGVPNRIAQESRTLSSELAEGIPGGPPPQVTPRDSQKAPPQPIQGEPTDLISGRSSANTSMSNALSRKSPTMDQGTQAGKPGAVGSSRQQQQQQPLQPLMESRGGDKREQQPLMQQQHQQNRNNNRGPPGNYRQQQGGWHDNNNPWNQRQPQQQQDGWGPQPGSRGGWRGGPRRGRGRGGNFNRPMGAMGSQPGPIGPPQQQRNQGDQGQAGGQKKNVLKFEGDYDFEQANTEFENLRSQLANIKLTATAAGPAITPAVGDPAVVSAAVMSHAGPAKLNGEDKKEVDSGNETGVGDTETEEDHEIYYDKAKSFFDNISCEAIERSKGCTQRTDWRQERKLNTETFGVSSARRGYRGRGGYYRGNSMYRGGGGFRGGFRGRGGYNRNPGSQQQQGGQNRPTATVGGK